MIRVLRQVQAFLGMGATVHSKENQCQWNREAVGAWHFGKSGGLSHATCHMHIKDTMDPQAPQVRNR